ncbi:EGF-like domain-containing protein [Tieghemostelium lacteum]|uniref:EGF-like domain-containing protein n=1 Tax=Tieghemostelium lacteum TaxID=361077 RepID=A0A151ZC73_TIELA|nr:EGF-like domain-containing protein [Tieghemostelium lacteum]|eukprot:KYQ91540.1 EGF-like domain-containing protein [Tieghemostelium lacteum]
MILNPNELNFYASTEKSETTQCKLQYFIMISPEPGDVPPTGTETFTADNSPISLIPQISLVDDSLYVRFSVYQPFNSKEARNITMKSISGIFLDQFSLPAKCITLPYPLVNVNTDYNDWKFSSEELGYYYTYLQFNLDRYLNIPMFTLLDTTSPYTCEFEQYGYTILKLKCYIVSGDYTDPLGLTFNVIIKDPTPGINRNTTYTIQSFIDANADIPDGYPLKYRDVTKVSYQDYNLFVYLNASDDVYFTTAIVQPLNSVYLNKLVFSNSTSRTLLFFYRLIEDGQKVLIQNSYSDEMKVRFETQFNFQTPITLIDSVDVTFSQSPNTVDSQLFLFSYEIDGEYYDYDLTFNYGDNSRVVSYDYPFGTTLVSGGLMQANIIAYLPKFVNLVGSLSAQNLMNPSIDVFSKDLALNSLWPADEDEPGLISIQIIPIGHQQVIVRVNAFDNTSGVYSIQIYELFQLYSCDIVSGTINNGTFEKYFDYRYSITSVPPFSLIIITDLAGNSKTEYLAKFPQVPLIPDYFYYDNLLAEQFKRPISRIYFKSNNVDLTSKNVKNSLYIYIENSHPEDIIRLEINCINVNVYGYWNSKLSMYQADFTLPMNMHSGVIPYNVYYRQLKYDSIYLPPTGQLSVVSESTDRLPPLIVNITQPQTDYVDGGIRIQWTIKIEDSVNGFSIGMAQVRCLQDPYNSYTYEFVQNGSMYLEEYNITIIVPNTGASLIYNLVYMELYDRAGLKSVYNDLSYIQSINRKNPVVFQDVSPFCKWDSFYSNFLTIPINGVPKPDSQPPSVTEVYQSSPSIDVTAVDRSFSLTFTIVDIDSKLSQFHVPKCFLHGILFQTVNVTAKLIYEDIPLAIANYTCIFDNIPYGFGYPGASLYYTISGYSDIYLNIGGTSPSSKIGLLFTQSMPIIETVLPIPQQSNGDLTIVGKNFYRAQFKIKVEYTDETFDYITNITKKYQSYMVITTKYKEIRFIWALSLNDDIFSRYIIPEYTIPIIPVIRCPGTPECGGTQNGVCQPTGCQCTPPWTGLECLSQIINTTPKINSTNPSINTDFNTTLPDGEQVSLRTLVSFMSLNELNQNGQAILSHVFTTWIYTNTTSKSSLSDIQEYTYQTTLKNSLNTNVTVTLQYFTKGQVIEFANQKLEMLASTIKYRIDMSPYPFQSTVNSLRLIMNTALESNSNIKSSCSSQESIDTDDSQYVKLQVDTHSLYGRFIKRGIIDYRVQTISNTIGADSTTSSQESNQTSYSSSTNVGINIPYYKYFVTLDPDFSILVDTKGADTKENSLCNQSSNDDSNNSKLTSIQIAGIVIAIVGALVALGVGYAFYRYKVNKRKKEQQRINKLSDYKF